MDEKKIKQIDAILDIYVVVISAIIKLTILCVYILGASVLSITIYLHIPKFFYQGTSYYILALEVGLDLIVSFFISFFIMYLINVKIRKISLLKSVIIAGVISALGIVPIIALMVLSIIS